MVNNNKNRDRNSSKEFLSMESNSNEFNIQKLTPKYKFSHFNIFRKNVRSKSRNNDVSSRHSDLTKSVVGK